ncbi:hypothetical protein IAR55_006497 [Kwoniella newhampshirensis]|uniref:Kelch repeat-containing protein n=1 Tax=Kwoniella newhampshirensis TaxID=1651941 RepID=A0AAW0YHL2_9TREE
MDSNGRHRNQSGSNLTLPASSTFRRLPTLARSPFRRSDKTSSPPPVDLTRQSDSSTHQRVSTFPSSSQVVIDDNSVSSAFFSSSVDQSLQVSSGEAASASSKLLPPSRSSSLLRTSQASDVTASNPGHPPLSPFAQKANPPVMSSTQTVLPPVPYSSNASDLEPITYPSHLAQTKAPGNSIFSSTSQSIHPQRDTSSSSATLPIVLGAVHQVGRTASGAGGPPFGVPKRKESIVGPDTSPNDSPDLKQHFTTLNNANELLSYRERDGETDSGTDDKTTRRRRADTRSSAERPQPVASSSNERGHQPSDRDRSRKASRKVSRAKNAKVLEPILPSSRGISRAPASAMYFSPVPCYGKPPNQALRAHSGTLVGERIWVIGGVDRANCWRGVASFDTESLLWTTIETCGEQFPPLRAHTTTLVEDRLYIFGGGDGPSYSNEVWMSIPPPRRAHTTVFYHNSLVIFGGGNGQAALNDVWALDVSDPDNLSWSEWKTKGDIPQKKGYHTANLVGDKMVVFGGSDGHASFADVHILNLRTRIWTLVNTEVKHNRLSHTSTQVGSYLFILGGHNGQTYAQDVLLFNLVTLQWESKIPRGLAPPGRGYHVALLHDARIFISGGYNGESVFDDLWALDLSAGAYLPQVTTFEVDETSCGQGERT